MALDLNGRDPSYALLPVLLPGGSLQELRELSAFLAEHVVFDLSRGVQESPELERLLERIRKAADGWRPEVAPIPLPAGRVREDFERLNRRFEESLRPLLAGGTLIRRQEARSVLQRLREEAPRVIAVHGTAGSGKSGVLLEVAEALAQEGTPYLALRLDRLELKGTPAKFGVEELSLPASPARCLLELAGPGLGVLLVDQLDALRWTGAHSAEAWDVCREMIEEAGRHPNLRVVVCCRTFDLEHDPQFRTWASGDQAAQRAQVGELTNDDLTAALERVHPGSAEALPPRERSLLRHVLHLQMWLEIRASHGTVPELGSSWALLERFWASRKDALRAGGIRPERIDEIERRLVTAFREGAVLSAPLRRLDLSRSELDLFRTLHLLTVVSAPGGERVNLAHQSYLDFLVAKAHLAKLDAAATSQAAEERLHDWLGSRELQTLFRRDQLRLLLGALRAEKHDAYLPALKLLLPAQADAETLAPIRFHLRYLALEFLGQVEAVRAEELDLVLQLLDEAAWRGQVVDSVVRGQLSWFEALDDRGILERWLGGDDEELRTSALWLLTQAAEHHGDRVAHLLGAHIDPPPEWASRLEWVLRHEPAEDSEALFALRLKLVEKGLYSGEYVNWKHLVEREPLRFVHLVEKILMAMAAESARASSEGLAVSGRRLNRLQGLRSLTADCIPREHRAPTWARLSQALSALIRTQQQLGEESLSFDLFLHSHDDVFEVLTFLRIVGAGITQEDWRSLHARLPRNTLGHRGIEILMLDALGSRELDRPLADWALAWLMADPMRLELQLRSTSNRASLAARLIERASAVCSDEVFSQLEGWILSYREPELLDDRRYLRRSGKAHQVLWSPGHPNAFGKVAHVLLPSLSPPRASDKTRERRRELERKFGPAAKADDPLHETSVHAGFVTSPIDEQARSQMTDAAWLKLAGSPKPGSKRRKQGMRFSNGHFRETSLETLASDFRLATKREPERFARLVLRWPPDGHLEYLDAILGGLSSPPDGKPVEGSPPWEPAPHEALEKALLLAPIQERIRKPEGRNAARQYCWLLRKFAALPWSPEVLDGVGWIASRHPEPEAGFWAIRSLGTESEPWEHLDSNALNLARGSAAFTIEAILFQHADTWPRLQPALEHLVRDAHPAVRAGALHACIPVLNLDEKLAVQLFLTAVEGEDALLATSGARRFLRYSILNNLHELLPTLDRMLAASRSELVTAGASLVASLFLMRALLPDRFESCLHGTAAHREGVAEAARGLLQNDDHAQAAKGVLLQLADDEDPEVAAAVARSFEALNLQHIQQDPDAWSRFARSQAFQHEPLHLLRALEKQSGDLLPFAECLMAVAVTFTEELADASRDHSRRYGVEARTLVPLLLRLYEQSKDRSPALHQRCLDVWDRWLERRVSSVLDLTRELDRV